MVSIFLGSSPFWNAYTSSDGFGKLIFISLFFLSVTSWFLIAYKTWLLLEVRKRAFAFKEIVHKKQENFFSLDKNVSCVPKELSNSFLEIYRTLRKQTLDLLRKNRQFMQRGKKEIGLEDDIEVYLSPSDVEFVDVSLQITIAREKKILEKDLFYLSTIVSLAPFLGLLGTVWGILITFGDLQANTLGSSNQAVLGGLSMALATTVVGLVVAIPALISFNYLKQKIRDFETEMESFSNDLLATVEMLYRKVDVK